MKTVFNYGITPQEMLRLNISEQASYLRSTGAGQAMIDVCNLFNLRGEGRKVVELFLGCIH